MCPALKTPRLEPRLAISGDLREDPTADLRSRAPFFEVPETIVEVVLALSIDVVITIDGESQVVSETQMLEFDLPRER